MVDFLYDQHGNRKYINEVERRRFLRAARPNRRWLIWPPVLDLMRLGRSGKSSREWEVFTFCLVLARTGGRISEVLALTPRQIDLEGRTIVFRTLKKRRKQIVYRAVPVPLRVLRELEAVHQIEAARQDPVRADERIWSWSRRTAWTRVNEVMTAAGITGLQASAKGLRHGFAVNALVKRVPLVVVQDWLGHARLETTAIYSKAVAAEARAIANRMWGWPLRLGLRW